MELDCLERASESEASDSIAGYAIIDIRNEIQCPLNCIHYLFSSMDAWNNIVDVASSQKHLGLILTAAGAVLSGYLLSRRKGTIPPGPRGWPVIGNALNIPSKQPWKVYLKWSQDFSEKPVLLAFHRILLVFTDSDILSLSLPGASLIILNTSKAVNDLLVKRSAIYSDRYVRSFQRLITAYSHTVMTGHNPRCSAICRDLDSYKT